MFLEIYFGSLLLWYVGLYLRVVPDKAMTIWFAITILLGFIFLYLACLPVYYIGHVFTKALSKADANKYCTYLSGTMLRCVRWVNPQLRVHQEYDHHKISFADVPSNAHIMFNHMSFWDSLNYYSVAPLDVICTKKTLMKASIMKMPIAGPIIFKFMDHFPVYFASAGADDFGVDKDKQDKVMKNIDSWLNVDKRGLGYCPEGKMGVNPSVVQPLRYGMLKIIAATNAPVYVCTQWQNEVFWPPAEAVGGHAADVGVTLAEYKYKDGKEPVPKNAAGEFDVAAYATDMQAFMQREVDRLKAIMEKKGLIAAKKEATATSTKKVE